MGHQKGALKLRGTHGDFVFAQTKNGFVWKEKPLVDKSRQIDQRVKNNFTEFGTAGRAVKLIRDAFRDQIKYAKDRLLTSRMQTLMLQAIKADPVNDHGLRNAMQGDLAILTDFQCNAKAVLRDIIGSNFTTAIDRVAGSTDFNQPGFVPKQDLSVPDGATHFRIEISCSEIDFANGTHLVNTVSSPVLLIDNVMTAPIVLHNSISPNSTLPIFLAVGIRFAQVVNSSATWISNGEHSALSFVEIDQP